VPAAIPQDHLPCLWSTISTTPVFLCASSAHRLNRARPEDASHRCARELDSFVLPELLREVLVIETGVTAPPQCQNALLYRSWCLVRWGSADVPVKDSSIVFQSHSLADALHLARRETKRSRTLCYRHLTTLDSLDDVEPSPLVNTHPHPSWLGGGGDGFPELLEGQNH
jgi:hypothetical protein